jgi:hypothetical protein
LPVLGKIGELDAVIGEDPLDMIRHGFDDGAQEFRGCLDIGFAVQFGDNKLTYSVDRDVEVKLALSGADLGDVDMKEADGIRLELFLAGLVLGLGQPANAVKLQATTQGGACEVGDGGFQGIEAVVVCLRSREGQIPTGEVVAPPQVAGQIVRLVVSHRNSITPEWPCSHTSKQ